MELKQHCKERFQPAVAAIEKLLTEKKEDDKPILVAIDGRCGSGKTTLGEYLHTIFDCNLFHMDDFFLRMEQRTPERLSEPGGNVDYERFYQTVLTPLMKREAVLYQPFSCVTKELLSVSEVAYKQLNIIEGSYSMQPYFGDIYDLRIFMNISPTDQMNNILHRNGAEKAIEFQQKWIPMEEKYFDFYQVMDGAINIDWR